MDLTIVVPCFNEVDNVAGLVSDLRPVVERLRRDRTVELLFVDDGSSDGTAALLDDRFSAESDTRVIRLGRNRGLGAALRTGFQHASGEVIVATDSDASYAFVLIPKLLAALGPGIDVVTGSCYHPDGGVENVPRYRLLLSRTASALYRVLVDASLHTYTCMFRAYRRRVLDTVPFESNDFLAVTELLVNAVRMGYAVRELPCTLRVRRYGTSKARVMRVARSHLAFQWQLLRNAQPPAPRGGSGQRATA
jgi:dolichol-phosphate mannosyltransferase